MSLHSALMQTDMSHPSITKGAAMMMRHYDRSAGTAVTEWRNSLQSCQPHQLLPLLYVANEVLQNSKRNRGNKFLEAFAPVLGLSLQLICQRSPDLVEKVRRTVKIWGDRRVFSVRFVSELLKLLEEYRGGVAGASATTTGGGISNDDNAMGRFSPQQQALPPPLAEIPPPEEAASVEESQTSSPEPSAVTNSPTADDLMREDNDDDGAEDDDSLGFLDTSGSGLLDLNIDPDAMLSSSNGGAGKGMASPKPSVAALKRRRSSGSVGNKKRRSVLSTQSLQDLWNNLSSLQQSFDQSQTLLQGIPAEHLSTDDAAIQDLVGEELQEAYRKIRHYQKLVETERRNIHKIANSKHNLELEALRYIPWCQSALKHDEEDIDLCNKLETEVRRLRLVHGLAKKQRDERKEKEREAEARMEQRRRIQQEIEEREALLERAMTRQEEAKPGMVWNKFAQEYQYLNTEEEWRD